MGRLSTEFGHIAADAVASESSRTLEVHVLFTDIPSTLNALRTAVQLAEGLTARIRLLLIETVPYPLPLDEPRRNLRFLRRHFRTLIANCAVESASRSVETTAEILVCRDAWEGLQAKLLRNSVIVIGRRSRWWPCAEDRLARKLRAAGHDVIRTSAIPPFGLLNFTAKGLAHA